MPKPVAWAVAAALLVTQAFFAAVAFERLSASPQRLLRSFQMEAYRPVVEHSAHPELRVGDRVVKAGGREVRGRQDWEETLGRNAVEWTVRGEGGERMVKLTWTSVAPARALGAGGWFGFLVWPGICSLLAVAALFWNGESKKAWTGALALAGMAQTHSYIVPSTDFEGALRWWMALAAATLPVLGLISLYRIAMNWPRRWWDSRAGSGARVAVYALIGAYGALRFGAEVLALADYDATEPLAAFGPVYSLMGSVLTVGAGVALALRSLEWNANPYPGADGRDAHILKVGQWVFCGGLGIVLILGPLMTEGGVAGILSQPMAWLPLVASLALPAAVAVVAARKEERVELATPPPVNAENWQELRDGVAGALPPGMGLRLLALYGRAGGQYCVRWSTAGVRAWEPLGEDETPDPVRDILWLEMPLEGRPRAGWMVFLSEDVAGRPGEAVVEALEKLARAAAPVAARLAAHEAELK
jgi:hypothetical protein